MSWKGDPGPPAPSCPQCEEMKKEETVNYTRINIELKSPKGEIVEVTHRSEKPTPEAVRDVSNLLADFDGYEVKKIVCSQDRKIGDGYVGIAIETAGKTGLDSAGCAKLVDEAFKKAAAVTTA